MVAANSETNEANTTDMAADKNYLNQMRGMCVKLKQCISSEFRSDNTQVVIVLRTQTAVYQSTSTLTVNVNGTVLETSIHLSSQIRFEKLGTIGGSVQTRYFKLIFGPSPMPRTCTWLYTSLLGNGCLPQSESRIERLEVMFELSSS